MEKLFKLQAFLLLLPLLKLNHLIGQSIENPVKVLIVVAHPDDESLMATAIYKITHEQGGIVDEAVMSNGEGGYKYSLFANAYYHQKLTDEKTGREQLPHIRKQELMNAGKIIGIWNFYFFDQKDAHFGLDEKEPLDTTWNTEWIQNRLKDIIVTNKYDFIFCLLPDSATHAHHKAATIIALRCVQNVKDKPLILAVSTSNKKDSIIVPFFVSTSHLQTRISSGKPLFRIDRNTPLGFNSRLNYKTIVNWEIAEHKSQGALQMTMNDGDYENFWYFDINDDNKFAKAEHFFEQLNNGRPQ